MWPAADALKDKAESDDKEEDEEEDGRGNAFKAHQRGPKTSLFASPSKKHRKER